MNGVLTCSFEKWPHFALGFLIDNVEWNSAVKENPGVHSETLTSSYINEMLTCAKKAFSPWHKSDGLCLIDNLVCAVDECKRRKDVEFAHTLHSYIHSLGLEAHEVLGNYLVPLLVDCGGFYTAHQVFERLCHRNEHSWTSLIQGYVGCGDYDFAFSLLEKMQGDGVTPNKYTFLALLRHCIKVKWLEEGKILHFEIVKEEFDEDPFIGNTLATLYARSGLLREAYDVFNTLRCKDVAMWNTLISSMIGHGFAEKALGCLEQMESEQTCPDIITYACSLKACRMIEDLNMGRKIHLDITRKGLGDDSFVGSTLVGMYADCGCLEEARTVFSELSNRDVVLWSTIILGFVNQRLGKEALSCLKQMQCEDVSPDAGAFVCSLKACCYVESVSTGQEIHIEIVKHGFDGVTHVISSLLDMYAKHSSFAEALEVFEKQPVRDVVMWNTLITIYAEQEMAHTTLACLKQMQSEGTPPNAVTLICSLKACTSICAIEVGREIHALIIKEDLDQDSFIANSLVSMYANSGRLVEAREIFDELLLQDVVAWSALIAGYTDHELEEEALICLEAMQSQGIAPNAVTYVCSLKACGSLADKEQGLILHAEIIKKGLEIDYLVGNTLVYMYSKCSAPSEMEEVFNGLVEKDVVSWNAAILGFSEQGNLENAHLFYQRMQEQGELPDSTTLASIIKVCGNATGLEMGKRMHSVVYVIAGHESILSTALIDMYGRCGSMVDAQQTFDQMPTQNLMNWTSLITGYAHQGESRLVLQLFEKMRGEGIQPNGVTFLSVLSACKHGGFAEKAQHYLKMMTREYNLFPSAKHQNCVIDLFCRSGRVHELMPMLKCMPSQPSLVTWSGVMSACQQSGDVELATKAFDNALGCADNQAAPFIFLSNTVTVANR